MNASGVAAIHPPRRLRLVHLFVGIAATAFVFAIGTQFGERGVMLAVLLATTLLGIGTAWWWRKGWLVLIPPAILAFLSCVAFPFFTDSRTPSNRFSCSNNLKNLVLALHLYHEEHGSFPPAYVAEASGKPLYSWRVLLLPYLEQNNLYAAFHKDEPWDSPHNLPLAKEMSSIFRCPTSATKGSITTTYVAVIGDETVWPGVDATALTAIKDGPSKTLALIEWPESDIIWTEPRDLLMADVDVWWQVPVAVGKAPQRHSGGGVNVAFADGHIAYIVPHKLSAKELRSLLTHAGNDTVPSNDY